MLNFHFVDASAAARMNAGQVKHLLGKFKDLKIDAEVEVEHWEQIIGDDSREGYCFVLPLSGGRTLAVEYSFFCGGPLGYDNDHVIEYSLDGKLNVRSYVFSTDIRHIKQWRLAEELQLVDVVAKELLAVIDK